jgi:hypothetical protein
MHLTRTTLAVILLSIASTHAQGSSTQSPADVRTIEAFKQNVTQYALLHRRLESTIPKMPTDADPQAIDQHQLKLGQLVMGARRRAKRGDVFTPEAERLFRRLLGEVFSGPEGASLKATVMDENSTIVKLAVNAPYPDEVPFSTMPPQVLAVLPRLPEEVEYRFIGNQLILLDIHAHTIVDYIDRALPK